ncbi:hypothetical protein EMIHUDRAFT_99628 [Emiliania huxleyi CCMP1516]|uniref:DNA-(apurinic or apyrimidinic site) endonuclease n=2 Tax=Emiliania huxleyi TaxID=2903 RepID=A0A0D3K087_EMIH1|nr:hypothetical protein EMIHUDRAFT_99628 [Emiliania huxleyi CCMP1516]EOD29172.1 hypothetical protein EMIHUDRAFT_99628 [Emiliania huxleyi CCMP1516]|eukprot:XP_005781601.1 hypothetical protein EMIHUDRAFT_99628 [Emiliania huxleyi CCMP1516]
MRLPLPPRLWLAAPASVSMSHISMSHSDAELASLTVAALKERLRERGLRVSGRKADLIERLSAPLSSPSPGPPPPLPPPPRAPRRPNSARPPVPIDATPRKAGAAGPGARRLRAASWNVAGLRGLLRREEGRSTLRRLVDEEGVDVLMLQETKLQESHVAEVEAALYEALGGGEAWRAAWACSTARKGYAGVSTLWRRRVGDAACRPLSVDPAHEADREGRALLWELSGASAVGGGGGGGGPRLKLINVYVPNSGADLQRLEYRTDRAAGWDARFRAAIAAQATGESRVCVCGDMNAGTTPEERASLRCFLAPPLGMRDAFRQVHGRAAGQYTYWSQRARARPANRGLRIDYFLLASGVPPAAVVDVQHLQEMHGSDHCPILLELDLARL